MDSAVKSVQDEDDEEVERIKKPKLTKSLSTPGNQSASTIPRVFQRPPLNRSLTRTESIKQSITSGTATFFGIPGTSDYESDMQKWNKRRMRHCSRRYGRVKELAGDDISYETADYGGTRSALPTPSEPMAPGRKFGDSAESGINSFGRTISVDSRSLRKRANTLTRRDSVAKMAWDGLSSLVKSPARKRHPPVFRKQRPSRSFSPHDVILGASEDSVFESQATPASAPTTPQGEYGPFLAPTGSYTTVMEPIEEHVEEIVATDGIPLRDIVSAPPAPELRRSSMRAAVKPHLKLQRTVTPGTDIPESSPLQDDVFFDITPKSAGAPGEAKVPANVQFYLDTRTPPVFMPHEHHHVHVYFKPSEPGEENEVDSSQLGSVRYRNQLARKEFFHDLEPARPPQPAFAYENLRFFPQGTQIGGAARFRQAPPQPTKPHEETTTLKKIWSRLLSTALNNSDRRVYGEGVVGRFFGRRLKKPSELSPKVQEKLDDFDDYRPFFTYWVTIVQILVLIFSLFTYGFGPFGFGRTQYASMVLQTSLVLEQVAYFEKENFWIGPRYADLVHLGAKYSPCMRRDRNIYSVIDKNKEIENSTACCIRNDGTGCYQTTHQQCPSLLSVWHKWNGVNNPESRTSGSVCNQDPQECVKPFSREPFKWPDDITKWPICKESVPVPRHEHTKCELTGRPCCFGIVGECRITTREYCDFVRGYFHEEATLCSQVSCLGEVCGMMPFVSPDHPNQFYRLFISIFLHAGLIHILFTIVIQFFLMRDLEKLIGWFRLSIIYLGSGIGGNLASAVFVPYETEVGPAGCQFGLLAALFVDAIYSWRMIVKPVSALLQLTCVALFLFIVGLLPWIDNWAHGFGFIFGGLLSLALFPYIQMDKNDHKKRIIIVVISLCVAIVIFGLLLTLFYFTPLWECKNCVYFNCIPFTDHFCDNKGLWLNPLPF